MLIIIILAVLFLASIVLLIIYNATDSWHDNLLLLGAISFCLFGIPLLVCGIVCIVTNVPLTTIENRVEITARIDILKDKQFAIYQTLAGELNLSIKEEEAVYHVIIDKPLDMAAFIHEYNCEVIDFKKDLYMDKVANDNIWINWFVNPGFKEVEGYNDSATNYKDILGDTLKTFELTKGEK